MGGSRRRARWGWCISSLGSRLIFVAKRDKKEGLPKKEAPSDLRRAHRRTVVTLVRASRAPRARKFAMLQVASPLCMAFAPHPRLPSAASLPIRPRIIHPPTAIAPSGIDELPYAIQTGLPLGVRKPRPRARSAFAYESARRALPSVWWDRWETWSAFTLGVTFTIAGRSHFTMPEAFKAIYPPIGTWGFWYLPGSSDFHVAWTGVAELCGGTGLLLGCLLSLTAPDRAKQLLPFAARAVLLLVLCVTPANVYMFTHGALMPGVTEGMMVDGELPVGWHAGRFAAQAIVLSVLLTSAMLGPAADREEEM